MGRNAKYSSSFFFVIKVDITRGKRIDNRKEDLNFPSDNSHAVFRTRRINKIINIIVRWKRIKHSEKDELKAIEASVPHNRRAYTNRNGYSITTLNNDSSVSN
jgi:hypothetical protein